MSVYVTYKRNSFVSEHHIRELGVSILIREEFVRRIRHESAVVQNRVRRGCVAAGTRPQQRRQHAAELALRVQLCGQVFHLQK